MKVKIIKDYNDLVLKRLVKKHEMFTINEARGKVLIDAGVAERVVDELSPEPKKKPKKKV
jgi:hypothetical protein